MSQLGPVWYVQVLLQGDYAFRKNELGEVMYFINFGFVDICNEDRSVGAF